MARASGGHWADPPLVPAMRACTGPPLRRTSSACGTAARAPLTLQAHGRLVVPPQVPHVHRVLNAAGVDLVAGLCPLHSQDLLVSTGAKHRGHAIRKCGLLLLPPPPLLLLHGAIWPR